MLGNKITMGAIAMVLLGVGTYFACDTQDGASADRTNELEVLIRPQIDIPLRDNPDRRPSTILLALDELGVHHKESGWMELDVRATIDLLAPEDAIPALLGMVPLPDGQYDQLRFHVEFSAVEIDRQWYPLAIPSQDSSGLKFHTEFCLYDGETLSLEMDFDIDESLHYNESRGYWLEPSITVQSPPTCVEDMRNPPARG